jgi:glutathione-regulated potassium-efflux system ancillary protein KefC
MSTGLTFGTISALFGLTHGIVSPEQYSHLVAVVIGSALVPTLVANALFMPGHLLTPSVEAARLDDAAAIAQRRHAAPPEPLEEG